MDDLISSRLVRPSSSERPSTRPWIVHVQPRTTPLAYTRDGSAYVVIASKGGAPSHPAWYHNLLATPAVTVEVDGQAFPAVARPVVDSAERRRLYDAQAQVMPGFRDYEARTERVIPVIRLERVEAGPQA